MRVRAFHAGIIDAAGPLTDFEIVLFDHTGQSDSDTKTVVFPGELGRVEIPFQTLDSEEGVELVPGRSYDLGYVFTVTDCRIPVALRGGVVEVDTGGGWRRMTYLRGGSITWYPRDCPTLDRVAASVSNSQFVSFATAGQSPTR